MAVPTPLYPDRPLSLALAVVGSSTAPLVLLDGDLAVIAASASFHAVFQIATTDTPGASFFEIGEGEWNTPRLRALLAAAVSGMAEVDGYEMELKSARFGVRNLVLNAHKLDYGDGAPARLLLAVTDLTETRASERLKDDLLREKAILLQEVQHRVANSLQIIASVILQSARKVQSEESRLHLRDAHNRLMSVAALQKQLATSQLEQVELRPYFSQLCASVGASMIRDQDQLVLEVDCDDSVVPSETSISLGLIVTELVINALKHAFPGSRHGRIVVSYQGHGANWTLAISDDGIGMSRDPDVATPGLGTSIVEALAHQLQARVQVADGRPGTRVSIVHTQLIAVEAESLAGRAV